MLDIILLLSRTFKIWSWFTVKYYCSANRFKNRLLSAFYGCFVKCRRKVRYLEWRAYLMKCLYSFYSNEYEMKNKCWERCQEIYNIRHVTKSIKCLVKYFIDTMAATVEKTPSPNEWLLEVQIQEWGLEFSASNPLDHPRRHDVWCVSTLVTTREVAVHIYVGT